MFSGFDEGPLDFLPTYRVVIDGDIYDEKRCPAWTDRVLWKVRVRLCSRVFACVYVCLRVFTRTHFCTSLHGFIRF